MKKFAPLLVIIAATLWGTMGLFTRRLTAMGFTPFDLTLVRASMTALFLLVYFFLFHREKLKIKRKDLPLFLITSLVSSILFNYCYTSAINAGSTGIASTLLYTAPIFVTVISAVVLKESITPMKLVALGLSFVGCVLVSGVVGSGVTLSAKALCFGIASGLTYGLYSIFSKIGMKTYSPLTFTAYTFLTTTLLVFPFQGVELVQRAVSWSWEGVLLLLAFGFATNVIPYICFTTGLKYMDAGKANITATIEPVVATVLGIFLLSETLTFCSAMGIFLVLLSAILLNVKVSFGARKKKEC